MSKKKSETEDSQQKYLKSAFLSKVILNEIEGVLIHYNQEQRIELLDHFINLFDELLEYSETKDFLSSLQKFTNREVELLKKYRSAYKHYEAKNFSGLFDFNQILLEKGYYTEEVFNALPPDEKRLNDQDVSSLCNYMDDMLHKILHSTYLEETNPTDSVSKAEVFEENDTDMTEARRLLAIHYLFVSTLGITPRGHTDVSNYARFAHLLLGKKITKLQDSNIYKKYKKLPYFNKGHQLIKDLQFIKPFFVALELQKAVDMIEKEIEAETNDLKT